MSLRKLRFFAPNLSTSDDVELADFEIPHIQRSLRLKPGTEIELFDGKGQRANAELTEVQRRIVKARLTAEPTTVVNDLPLTLAVAPPKGKRALQLIEKLTELNVATLIPLIADFGEWQRKNFDKTHENWQRRSLEACKQCHRDSLLKIEAPVTVKQLIQQCSLADSTRFFGAPGLEKESHFPLVQELSNNPVVVAIGPEGGWSPAEIDQFANNEWRRLQLGETVLRVETAAVGLAAIFALKLS